MNTTDLVNEMSESLGITKTLSKKTVDFITARVMDEVRKGKQVKLTGFGIFYPSVRQARKGRNPQNGDPVQVPERKVVRFKAGKKFKAAIG